MALTSSSGRLGLVGSSAGNGAVAPLVVDAADDVEATASAGAKASSPVASDEIRAEEDCVFFFFLFLVGHAFPVKECSAIDFFEYTLSRSLLTNSGKTFLVLVPS